MIIRRVRVRNFRSMLDVELEVPAPGLYLISGRNGLDEKLGSNGAGKSTLVEALHWAFTGRTSRGVSGPSLEPWSGSAGRTSVALETDAGDIVRRRAPNVLEGAEPNPLEAKVAIHPQFSESFLDLSPAERMALFERAFRGEYWEEVRGRVQAEARAGVAAGEELATRQETLDSEIRRLSVRLDLLMEDRRRLSSEERYKGVDERIREIARRIEDLTGRIDAMVKKGDEADAKRDSVTKRIKEEAADQDRINGLIADVEVRVKLAAQEIEALRPSDSGECSLCGQKLPEEKVAEIRNRYEEKVDEGEKLDAEAVWLDLQIQEVRDRLTALRADEKVLLGESVQAELDLSDKMVDRRRLEVELSEARDIKREQGTGLAVIDGQIEEVKKSMSDIEGQLAALGKQQGQVDRDLVVCEYWTRGFNELRLRLAEDAALSLAEISNVALSGLGMSDWRIRFEMERETKSKTLTQKFHALVSGPEAEDVPYSSWSGGEGQRLRLAAAMGFSDLVGAYHGLKSNVEFWDEPDCHLSGEGLDCLIRSLRARSRSRAVFLITHNRLAEGEFDGTYMVEKNNQGITTLEAR